VFAAKPIAHVRSNARRRQQPDRRDAPTRISRASLRKRTVLHLLRARQALIDQTFPRAKDGRARESGTQALDSARVNPDRCRTHGV
jgi:hypothetical protein